MASVGTVSAEDESPPPQLLRFSAVNAGYNTATSQQNYDFIELSLPDAVELDDPHPLADYYIVYTNSSGNPAGEIHFGEYDYLASPQLLLGFKNSPQYQSADPKYLYTFSSAGLASTAGKLELFYLDEMIDELCWGKITCAQQFAKFSTTESDNRSVVLCAETTDCDTLYYPEIDSSAIVELPPEAPPADIEACPQLQITEILSYYEEDSSEQFVELFNPSAKTVSLDTCRLNYKKKTFELAGTLASGQYLAFQDDSLSLTKNPTKNVELTVVGPDDSAVASVSYGKKQKKGSSYAYFGNDASGQAVWRQTYHPTPGSANVYQEFQSCEDGKVINPKTGNCIKAPASTAPTACKTGYYRNPATGRCKKIATAKAVAECKTGYERNPTTNRCRKIVTETGQSFAPTVDEPNDSYDNPQIFIAIAALVATLVAALGYILFQFRHEIRSFFEKRLLQWRLRLPFRKP